MTTDNLTNVMGLSWELQRTKKYNRSRSLLSAWAIYLNEDIMVFRLVKKHSHRNYPNKVQPESLTLFNNKHSH